MTDPERSWRLLFDIALSHGASLRLRRLSLAGFHAFLLSAELVGPRTGVFPLLVDRLWHEHSRPLPDDAHVEMFGALKVAKPAGEEAIDPSLRVVGLEGFTDMMNVVSVRCYQVNKLSRLRQGDSEENASQMDLRRAIALSAEDHVRLEKSVRYTANEYLKSFIHRNTIHPSSVVALRACVETDERAWTPHVRSLVSYLVETTRTAVILPLFKAYSGAEVTGCMSRAEFIRFVQEVFPHFTAMQQAVASSVFDYPGLTDIQQFLKLSTLEAAQAEKATLPTASALSPQFGSRDGEMASTSDPSLSLKAMHGATTPWQSGVPAPAHARAHASRLIGLDGFVDALLMLSVVVFANEEAFPHHRPISAKIWCTFVEYYGPAAKRAGSFSALVTPNKYGASQLPDPLFLLGKDVHGARSVTPTLSQVYPRRVPVDRVSSLLVCGLPLVVDPSACCPEGLSRETSDGVPPRLLTDKEQLGNVHKRPPRTRKELGDSTGFSSKASETDDGTDNVAGDGSATFLTGVDNVANGVAPLVDSTGSRDHATPAAPLDAHAQEPTAVVTQACALFNARLDSSGRPERSHGTLGTFRRCHVYVDEEAVQCVQRGPNQVEALLPLSTWHSAVKLMKLHVSVELLPLPGSSDAKLADGSTVRVAYTPSRSLTVSLRDAEGEAVYTSMDVEAVLNPHTQHISAELVARLASMFYDRLEGQMRSFEDLCTFLEAGRFVRRADVHEAARAAVELAHVKATTFTFLDTMAVLAMLPCTRYLGGDAYTVPSLASFLRVAFAKPSGDQGSTASATASAASVPLDTGADSTVAARTGPAPYSLPVEGPFHAATQRRALAARELSGPRESVFRQLKEARARLVASEPGSETRRVLPPFPASLTTNALFTHRRVEGDETCVESTARELQAVATCVQTALIQHQLVIQPLLPQTHAELRGTGAQPPQ